MRSLVRVAGVVGVTAVLSAASVVGAVTAYAVDGDERVARVRVRMVDAVNRETRDEIDRLRRCTDEASRAEADRLERLLRDSCLYAEQLHSVRTPLARNAAVRGETGSYGVERTYRVVGAEAVEAPGDPLRAAREVAESQPVGAAALVVGTSVLLVGGGAAVASVRWRRDQ
ncbi:hypothetical protein [Streptomyces sp. BPTC-684]|uniref:hypothetical protein n=1 Tax=Streptomyces sp. BPTC-684 TaxID=3043734 RepID=UPI0024B1268B|nr:hypothetical protein [Streptomyces sp. BPTC-684]WHM37334.1 hypothetical protein QIY60_10750 [Streptomyces sp. BPTC-684]